MKTKPASLLALCMAIGLASCTNPFKASPPSAVVEHLRAMNVVNGVAPDGTASTPRTRAQDQSAAFWGGAQP